MTSTSLRSATYLLASLALAACNGSNSIDGGVDAQVDGSADARTDAGTDTRTDTGSPIDTGVPTDTGTPVDTGNPIDTGTPTDTGTVTDAGHPDGSVTTDAATGDATVTDASTSDASVTDVVTGDASTSDGAVGDASTGDAGSSGDASTITYSFANPLQVDLSSIFTVDTVANTSPTGQSYPPLSPVDGSGNDFLTASVASGAGDPGGGLPDDGYFASDGDHPNVQLAFSNTSVALNSVILNAPGTATTVTIPIPAGHFSTVALYLTSTEGPSTVSVTLQYSDSTTSVTSIAVPDWFNYFSAASPVYVVVSGLSRFSASQVDDFSDTPALYGVNLSANSTKTLTGVNLNVLAGSNRIALYGATAY